MASGIASGNKPTGVVDLDSSQTLENKTLDSTNTLDGSSIENPSRLDVKQDTQANLETYALTATNGQLCFATDTKLMYQVVDNALTPVGSGSGGINYIENSDFEIDADGWTGDTNLTIARSTSSPLRGDASGVASKGAVDASGEVISIPFTIDSADLAKKLYISADVDASDANYADGDLRWKIVKDPNGTPVDIRVNGEDILGGNFARLAWFQSDATITEYELQIECNSVNASAYSVKIDNISVGPREAAFGSAMTDWKSYTPTFTGMGTVTSIQIEYRRVGSNLEVRGDFVSGTPTAVEAQMTLPSGLSIENQTSSSTLVCGNALRQDTTSVVYTILSTDGDSFVNFGRISGGIDQTVAGNGDVLWTNAERVTLRFSVPIQGWSSNALMSEDIGNREVRVRGAGNAGESITAGVTDVPFTTVTDTTGSWDGSVFTAPETGNYKVTGSIRTTSGVTNNAINFYIDGTISDLVGYTGSGSFAIWAFAGTAYLEKGQTLSVRFAVGGTLLNTSIQHHIEITKEAQPQTLLETETVAARYTSDSGQSIANTSTDLKFEDIDFDTHNAYDTSTGIYTVPVTGKYFVHTSHAVASTATWQAGDSVECEINLNGSAHKTAFFRLTAARDTTYYVETSSTMNLVKGDQVKIVGRNTRNRTMSTSPTYNEFSIARIK